MDPDALGPDYEIPQPTRRVKAVAQRRAPLIVIVDLDVRPLGWSRNSDAIHVIATPDSDLRAAVSRCYEAGQQVTHAIDDDTVLRLMPLDSAWGVASVAIHIERYRRPRAAAVNAALAYGITKREVDILRLLVRGATNSQIAEALFIAQSTVADHIKNIMKKTQTTRRAGLVSKFANPDDDERTPASDR